MQGHVGSRVRQKREELELSQEELASRLRVPASQLKLWEGGLERIPPDSLIRVASILGVTFEWLFPEQPGGQVNGVDGAYP